MHSGEGKISLRRVCGSHYLGDASHAIPSILNNPGWGAGGRRLVVMILILN